MNVRWRPSAVSDLAAIRDFISENDLQAAQAVVDRVLRSVDRLEAFPRLGRTGQVPGTRELVVPGLPYIVVYTCDDADVTVIGVFHGARHRE